jgi:UDP-N-acetyl-D-glucosamine dehydrogenase
MRSDHAGTQQLEARLLDRIEGRSAVVGVIGLGYVGLPLALAFCEAGLKVVGFDIDRRKVEALNAGHCYIEHLEAKSIAEAVRLSRLEATGDFDRLGEPDALLIAVPTPLTHQREPDTHFITDSVEQIRPRLRPGQLVIVESTTYPGTTDELVRPLLERSGLVAGKDFFLAYSPEREDPGNKAFGTKNTPKIVGGLDETSLRVAERLYRVAIGTTVPVPSLRTAEAVKLTENIYRCVNIALVNELKVIYEGMGIDIWTVLDAASTKPFGFTRFNPGPGLGGHCIPIDPFYLTWKAREYGLCTRFVELAGEINLAMPRYVVGRLQDALNQLSRPVKGSRVLVLGVAYKKDIGDLRESPALELMRLLHERGAQLSYHDPCVPTLSGAPDWPGQELASIPLTPQAVAEHQAVLIATDHSAVDYAMVQEHARLVIDTRGVCRQPRPNVVRA